MKKITETEIVGYNIIGVLIGGLVGVIGILVVYSIFPNVIMEEPICQCPLIHERYEVLRSLISVLGFFLIFIPITIVNIYIHLKLNQEDKIESDM